MLLGLWLFGTVFGDLYLGSTITNMAKGIARVVFLGLDFTTLAILINGKTRGKIVFTLGFIPVMLNIGLCVPRSFLVAWKFGLGYAITLLAMLVSCSFYAQGRYWISVSIALGMAALNLIFAARSQIAIDLISLVLVLPMLGRTEHATGVRRGKRFETFRIVVTLTLACGAAYAANQAIKFGANHDFFDESTQDKFQTQEEGRLGVLVGGRPETLVAIQAIRDSPIIGHGSFAVDPKYNWLQRISSMKMDTLLPMLRPRGEARHTCAFASHAILGGIRHVRRNLLDVRVVLALSRDIPPDFARLSDGAALFFPPCGFYLGYSLLSYGQLRPALGSVRNAHHL